jgi:plastocyanin
MARSRIAAALALAAVGATSAGCGGGEDPSAAGEPAAPRQVTVKIASFKYLPETVRVRAGGSIAWENEDDTTHDAETVPDAPAKFDTQALDSGDTKRVTLEEPGTYAYFCSYHRFMEGTVEVVPDGR